MTIISYLAKSFNLHVYQTVQLYSFFKYCFAPILFILGHPMYIHSAGWWSHKDTLTGKRLKDFTQSMRVIAPNLSYIGFGELTQPLVVKQRGLNVSWESCGPPQCIVPWHSNFLHLCISAPPCFVNSVLTRFILGSARLYMTTKRFPRD